MEYDYYLEQKYLYEGRVEARILTAAQAQAMGYEDDYRGSRAGYKLYVDGFNTMEAIQNYLSDLVNCTLVEQEKVPDESKRLEAIADFVTFEDETSLIWPWAIPAEENVCKTGKSLLKQKQTLAGFFAFHAVCFVWWLCLLCLSFFGGVGNSFVPAFRIYWLHNQSLQIKSQ